MAATASAWATKPGAWALDAEEHEEELQQQRKAMEDSKSNSSSVAAVTADFPSLSAAAATKGKKKKGQTLSLAEFSSYKAPQANQAKGLTPGDLMKLPTGPRERTAEEMDASRIGGGFRSYGMGRSGGGDGDRWGGNRGSDEPRRESREPLGPSRADEIDDWAAGKKSFVGGNGGGFERRERTGGGFFGSDSKADESDSWVSKKSFTPSEPPRRFGSSGFERERRSYEPFTSNVGGVDSDTWGRKREERVVDGGENGQAGSIGGRPKLNLQPRTLPVVTERPQSPNVVARPQSPNVVVTPQNPDVVVKPRSFNPFGEARPREEVLAEKGQDWKKIDEQLESLKIKETGSAGAEGSDRPGSANKGFGRRGSVGEEKTERGWWKPESEDARPTRYWTNAQYKCYWRAINPDTKVAVAFGPIAAKKYRTNISLWQSLHGRGDTYKTLLREATTAYLNAFNSLQFPYNAVSVVQRTNDALSGSPRVALLTALKFKRANSGYGKIPCKLTPCK